MNKAKLFFGGFLQVSLVAGNTYAIKSDSAGMMIVFSFLLSFVWSGNIKKIVIGSMVDRVCYSAGASAGCMFGYYAASFINVFFNN